MVEVKIKLIHEDAELPYYATEGSSGGDLFSIDEDFWLSPNEIKMVRTGIKVAIPYGYEGQVRPRSGLATKKAITVVNAPGTIDSDYRGEVKVGLINLGEIGCWVDKHTRIAQLVIAPVVYPKFILVEDLEETKRGEGGWGSTGTGLPKGKIIKIPVSDPGPIANLRREPWEK